MMQLKVEGNTIRINDISVTLDYVIIDFFLSGSRIIVLLDSEANLGNHGQFKNLMCLKADGKLDWVAELPTAKLFDAYYKIAKKNPLIVYSRCSYTCEIDINTGKIIRKEFTK